MMKLRSMLSGSRLGSCLACQRQPQGHLFLLANGAALKQTAARQAGRRIHTENKAMPHPPPLRALAAGR